MLDKIIIVDFEDSFTYNIASTLFPFEKSIKVINHKEFFDNIFEKVVISKKKIAVILGPGPGNPIEHIPYFTKIKKLQVATQIYLMGICLGHQIIGMVRGLDVRFSLNQLHGQSVKIKFNGKIFWVQKYNSLAVFENNAEIDIMRYPRGISYQFHPESVGTSNNELFFKELLDFIG